MLLGQPVAAPTGGPTRLSQLDALRVLSCGSVILVHAVGGLYPIQDVLMGGFSALLHYSREVFFFVSALVLVRSYHPRLTDRGRLADEAGFRKRRLTVIGRPYLWWTTIYLALAVFHQRHVEPASVVLADLPMRWLYLVVTGNGNYHMYFLLISLQFAVVFPLLLRLLDATRGRHGRILAASVALQAGTLACYHWVGVPRLGWQGLLGAASLPAYQLWLVAGALAGLHLDRVHAWVLRYRALVVTAVPLAAAGMLGVYSTQVDTRGPIVAGSALQPAMIVWAAVALGGLYLAAVALADRESTVARAVVEHGARLSFGVYLAHPLLLDVVLAAGRRTGLLRPGPVGGLVATVLTVLGAVLLCLALERTRLSLALVGRPTRRPGGVLQRLARWEKPRRPGAAPVVLSLAVLAVLSVGGDQSARSAQAGWAPTPPPTAYGDR